MRLLEVDDPEWAKLQSGAGPDPYTTHSFQQAEGAALGYRPVLLEGHGTGWSAHYALQLWGEADRWVARTPEYGGPWLDLSGADGTTAATAFRAELDDFLRERGIVSEVAILSPFLPHAAAVQAVWVARPEKHVCLADLTTLEARWACLSKGRRSDINRARRTLTLSWGPLGPDAAVRFADAYAAAMDDKDALPRWRLDRAYFVGLAAQPDLDIRLCLADGPGGGAAALFLPSGERAAYLYATRWGDAPGSPSAVLWEGQQALAGEGVTQLLLGGGVTADLDDSLLRFKTSLADELVPLHIAARVFDQAGHDAGVAAGWARPLPTGAVEVGG